MALRLLTAWGFIFGGVGVAGFSIARSTLDLIEALICLSLATIVITGAQAPKEFYRPSARGFAERT